MVDVRIDGTIIPHTLIDIWAAINVMTKESMLKRILQGPLRETTIVLKLAGRSTIAPEGYVEDVNVFIDSWEYPTDLLALQPKTKFNG